MAKEETFDIAARVRKSAKVSGLPASMKEAEPKMAGRRARSKTQVVDQKWIKQQLVNAPPLTKKRRQRLRQLLLG